MYNSNYILVRNAEQNFMQTRVGVIGNELICNISIVVLEYHCDQRKIVEMRERERERSWQAELLSLSPSPLSFSHTCNDCNTDPKNISALARAPTPGLSFELYALLFITQC